MSNKVYNRLKWVSLVLLPALASLYFALGEVWHVPLVKEIVATITVLDTFLGFLLGKSSATYRRESSDPKMMGDIVITQDEDGTPIKSRMHMYDQIPVFEEGKVVAFKVKRQGLE